MKGPMYLAKTANELIDDCLQPGHDLVGFAFFSPQLYHTIVAGDTARKSLGAEGLRRVSMLPSVVDRALASATGHRFVAGKPALEG